MLKLKSLINVLLVLAFLFCYHSIDPSTACAFNYPNGNENVIVDTCPPEDSRQSSGGVSTITGDHNYTSDWLCPEDPSLEYDTVNSHETIARNGSTALFVIGSNDPFTWSVSGQGFWFDADYTVKTLDNNALTATLYADDSACGAATITVTDYCGKDVKGYVRCTTGRWAYPPVKICAPEYCWGGGPGSCTLIYGNIRYFTACEASWIPDPNCNEYDTLCDHSACIAAGGKIFSVCYQTWECP